MANEDIMAKKLRQMAPYMAAHDPLKYRRFNNKETAAPPSTSLTADEVDQLDTQEAAAARRKRRIGSGAGEL